MTLPVSRNEMEVFARALKTAKEGRRISPEQFRALHARFRAADSHQAVWTVGLKRQRWHRLERGQWVADEPPRELYLEDTIFESLLPLLPANPSVEPKKIEPGDIAPVLLCRKCAAALPAGKKFCSRCGTPREAEPEVKPVARRCPRCGSQIQPGKRFCAACGASAG